MNFTNRFENAKIGDKVRIYGGYIGRKNTVNTISRLTKKYIVVTFTYAGGRENDKLFLKRNGHERGGGNWHSLYAEPENIKCSDCGKIVSDISGICESCTFVGEKKHDY